MTDFIALDWGTTSFRAYRVGADGHVHDTVSAPEGILAVKDGSFEDALERHIGAWDAKLPVPEIRTQPAAGPAPGAPLRQDEVRRGPLLEGLPRPSHLRGA